MSKKKPPRVFRGDTKLARLDDGWLLLIWKEDQSHLADLPLDTKTTICGLDLIPEYETHAVARPDRIEKHLTCSSCLYFWKTGVSDHLLEKWEKRNRGEKDD